MGRQGFTLSEVMVAIVLVSVGALALVSVQIYSVRAGAVNKHQHTASVIGYQILSERQQQARQNGDFTDSVAVARTTVPGYEGLADDQRFDYQVADTMEPGSNDQVKRITVDVYYTDRGGPQKYELFTLLYDRH